MQAVCLPVLAQRWQVEPHGMIPRHATGFINGGARGPVILPVFKAGDPSLRGVDGGFDSHTLPPYSAECE